MLRSLIFSLILALVVGCRPLAINLPDEPTLPSSPESDSGIDTITSPMSSNTHDPSAQELILLAKVQLAKKLGIDIQEIFLFSVQAVEWPDASLGCPQAGLTYAQLITPGYQIFLEANGWVFTLHTDEKDKVILCNAQAPDEIFLPP